MAFITCFTVQQTKIISPIGKALASSPLFKIHIIIIHINNTDAGDLGHVMHHRLKLCVKGFVPI